MPRHPLSARRRHVLPMPPPPAPPWVLRNFRAHVKNYKLTLSRYTKYEKAIAKERRLRCAAQRESRLHAAKIAELELRLAEALAESVVAETDPYYCIAKTELKP